MSNLRETLLNELADIYDAEKQLVKALPKVANAAEHEDLRSAIEEHLEETQEHVRRLEQVFGIFQTKPKTKKCQAMQGLLKEGEEIIDENLGDAALICAAQKVEHYEIASYGSLRAWAELLEHDDAADILSETLDEEKAADEKLTSLAEEVVNVEKKQEGEGQGAEADEEEESEPSASRSRNK